MPYAFFIGESMLEKITLFNYEIQTYGLLAVIGFLVCLGFTSYMVKRNHLPKDDAVHLVVYACLGAAAGGKILYLLLHVHEFFLYSDLIFADYLSFTTYLMSGFIFYGGLVGAVIACIIYAKQFHLNLRPFLSALIPAIPLFHGFGRIGCFLGGCCYGIEMTGSFCVLYHSRLALPITAYRFPVQLWEATANFILFLILFYLALKNVKSKYLVSAYCLSYALIRFLLEFLRGDLIRGVYWLSVSQWISIVLFIFGLWVLKDQKERFITFFNQL